MQTRKKPGQPPGASSSQAAEDSKNSKNQATTAQSPPDPHVATRGSQVKARSNGQAVGQSAADKEKEDIMNDLLQLREGPPLGGRSQLDGASNQLSHDSHEKGMISSAGFSSVNGGSAGGNSTIIIGGSALSGGVGFADPKSRQQSTFATGSHSQQTAAVGKQRSQVATPLKKVPGASTVTAIIKKQSGVTNSAAAGAQSGNGTPATKGKAAGLNSITIPNGNTLAGTKRNRTSDDYGRGEVSYSVGGGGAPSQLDGGASYEASSHIDGDEKLIFTGKPVGVVVLSSIGGGGSGFGGASSDKNEESKVLTAGASKKATAATQPPPPPPLTGQQNKRPKVNVKQLPVTQITGLPAGKVVAVASSGTMPAAGAGKGTKSGQKGGQPQLTRNNLDEFNKANPGAATEMASVNNGDYEILSEDGQLAVNDLLQLFIKTYSMAANSQDLMEDGQPLPLGAGDQQKPATGNISANKKGITTVNQGETQGQALLVGVSGASAQQPQEKVALAGKSVIAGTSTGASKKVEDPQSITGGAAAATSQLPEIQSIGGGVIGFPEGAGLMPLGKRHPTPQEIEAALQNLQGVSVAGAQGEYLTSQANATFNQEGGSITNNALTRISQEQQHQQLLVDPALANLEQQRQLQQQLALYELLQHPEILQGSHPQEILALLQQYGITDQSILASTPLLDMLLKNQLSAGAPQSDASQQPQYAIINGSLHQINPYGGYSQGTAIVSAGGNEYLAAAAAASSAGNLLPSQQQTQPIQFKTPKYSHVSIAYMIKERQTALIFQQQQQQQHQNDQQAQLQLQQQQLQQQQNAQQSQGTQQQLQGTTSSGGGQQQPQSNQVSHQLQHQQAAAQQQQIQSQQTQATAALTQQQQQQVNQASIQAQQQQQQLQQQQLPSHQELNLDDPATALAYQQALQQQQHYQRMAAAGGSQPQQQQHQQVYMQGSANAGNVPAGYAAALSAEEQAIEALIQDQRIALELTQILSSLDPQQQISFIESQIQQNPSLQNVLIRVYQQLQGGDLNAQAAAAAQHYIEPSTGQIIDQYQLLALQQQQAQVQPQVSAHLAQLASLIPGFDQLPFQQQQAIMAQSFQGGNSGPIAMAIDAALIEYHQLRQQHLNAVKNGQ